MSSTMAVRRPSARIAVLRTEARLYVREFGTLFWVLGFPPVLLVILGSIPSFRRVDAGLGVRLIDLYVPVLVLVGQIVVGLQAMPPIITGYRERGILRRMSATPVRPSALLTAQMGLHGATGLASALICLTIGRLAFDVKLPHQLVGYVLALLLTSAAALALGALVSALARTARLATAFGMALFFPSLFSAGLWLPVQAMPHTLRQIVVLLPFGAASRALDQAAAGQWPAWSHLGVLAGWTVVVSVAAARWFRWE
ncbi:ABC-2 type transport system permease protein [Kribbella aluminosa]|uniref:ABC-2 type transport system permease protein n=1 Tax=Kribbella aluminosa TaxID=416017 RepID=A0ABS4UZC9_9ACTN|nr:ABC transporter permease [Kribbella aluminosa]MBP2357020.1 ABC-2 type transport system permease protein [Kribbella aluminosa]